MSTRNPLHKYVNWTYNLSLYAMSHSEYNANVYAAPTTDLGGTLLIASGGIQEGRNRHFKEDFYFEKMEIFSTVAISDKNRNANAYTISFTIVEPMGVSLFNRFISVAQDMGINKINALPFYIKVRWKGYNIDGTPAKIDIVKCFPISIATVDMKVNQRGSQYDCTAIPYAHSTFTEAIATTPVNVEISASTVGEALLHDIKAKPPTPGPNMVVGVAPTDDHCRSYTGAINTWFANQATEQHAKNHDSIVFELTKPMHGGKLVQTDQITPQSTFMPTPGTPACNQTCATTNSRPKANLNSNLTISQGTSVSEVLSLLLRESDWCTNQAGDEQQGGGGGGKGQAKWFKIIPRLEIGPWEPAFNRYVNKYVYRAVPYMVNNTKNRAFPLIDTAPGVAKDYQYIFTGKNDDILDLQLHFNALWINTVTTNQENRFSVSGGQVTMPSMDPRAWSGARGMAEAFGTEVSGGNSMFSFDVFPVATTTMTVKGNDGSKNEKSREMQEQVTHKPSEDMLSIDMKIIGDPDWIRQDDILFWNATGEKTTNGSITMDNKEVLFKLTAKTSAGYDANGLAIPGSGEYNMGAFSGIYNVLTCTSYMPVEYKISHQQNKIR
jgi:hypothetical protein